MFNPKGNNILDEQLAVSGLEMNIVEVLAGVSAVASIAGGIFGAKSASDQNARNREAQKDQQKLLNKQADLQNEYNKKSFKAQIENYNKQADYNFETALENYRYNTAVRALQEKTDAQKYLMNVENSQKQLSFNKIAEQQGQLREQLAINDAQSEYAFSGQDSQIAQLAERGRALLGQAGRGMQKRMQSTDAKFGRDLAVMNASLTGEINASHLRMFDISLGRYAADARVEAARMLRPERLPELPAPTRPPEPTWVAPMKVLPGMAAPAQQQSVYAPLISGIGSAAGSLASINWNPGGGGSKQPVPQISDYM